MEVQRTLKELVRHAILKSGLNGAYLGLRARRGQNVEHLERQTLGERFSAIYRNRVWLNGRAQGSFSGSGSDFENTKSIRQHLPELLRRLHTKTLLDIGCGDFGWMCHLDLKCQYVGIDCVPGVIDVNSRTYGSKNRAFHVLDAVHDPLPAADTVLCREILFHLSFGDIAALLANVRASGASTLIATTDVATAFNSDILSGDFRILNLTKSPFHFPAPELSIPDEAVSPGRILGVWKRAQWPE